MSRPELREGIAGALLLAMVAVVYAAVRHHGFIDIDDMQLIPSHPAHRDPLSLASVMQAVTRPHHLNWIPLTSLSLQLDVWLWGIDAGRTLVANAALHALAALLLWRALVALTGDHWRSLFVAAVFAVHPLHVESVAWASSRKDVLAGVCFGLTLLAYARFARHPSRLRFAAVALAFGLGLLSKPALVPLPALLLLLDFWPLGRIRGRDGGLDRAQTWRAAVEKLPLLALAIGASLVTAWAQRSGGAMAHLGELSLGTRLAQALLAVASYLGDALWPTGLAMPYPHPGEGVPIVAAAGSGALLAGVSLLAWQQRRVRPQLAVGWLWFLALLVPVLGLVPIGYAGRADRYTYLPLTGLAIALAWSVPDAWLRSRAGRARLAIAATGALVALALVAHAQVGYWRDTFRLMQRALDVTEDNSVAHLVLARAHARVGEVDAARPHFEAVFRLEPTAVLPVFEWAYLLDRRGATDEALAVYRRGGALDPGFGLGQEALADALERQGELEEALAHYARGRPGSLLALRGRARVAQRLGRHADALAARRRLVELRPGDTALAAELAFALASCPDPALRDPEAALALIEPVVAREPEDPIALDALAAALAASGRLEAASAVAERAVRAAGEREPLASAIGERLAGYRDGRPYIERR